MRITWLTNRHPPQIGGMARSSGRLVDSLYDAGHHVQVIHLSPPSTEISKTKTNNYLMLNWNRIKIPGINAPIDPPRIFATLQSEMADSLMVGFGGDYPGYLSCLWAKWLQTKNIVLFRGNDFDKMIHDTKRAWMTHFILQHADGVGAVSAEMTQRIAVWRDGPTRFTPNGIDTDEWRLFDRDRLGAERWRSENCPVDKPIIGLFGQLKGKKGLDLTLKMLTETSLRQHVYLLTVGELPDDAFAALQQQPENDFWLHVPFVKNDQLLQFYHLVDFVWVPSYYDGMPNVVLEAMALGKIVLGSRAGAIPDVIEDQKNGFLFDIGDWNAAADTLFQAIELNDNRKKSMGAAAQQHIQQQFTPQKEIESILALVDAVG